MMLPAFSFVAVVGGELPLRHSDVSIIALAVTATVCVIIAALTTWAIMRRRPPIEREIDDRIGLAIQRLDSDWKRNFADLRAEVLHLNQDRRVTIARLFDKLEDYRKEANDNTIALKNSVEEGFKDLHRALGRLEGKGGSR